MSDNHDSNNANNQQAPEKMGCRATLGVILLVIAILTVLFFLVLKPHLESKGIEVDSFFDHAKECITGAVGDLQERAGEVADNLEDAADDLEEAAEDLEESVQNIEMPDVLPGGNDDGSWY